MELNDLDLTDATRGTLEKRGIDTYEKLMEHSKDFTKIKGVGKGRATEIEEAIQAKEFGREERFEEVPEGGPTEEEVASEPPPFRGVSLGDLVVFTSEHAVKRYARVTRMDEDGTAGLTVFTNGGRYDEKEVPHSKVGKPMSWHPKPGAQ